MNKIWINRRAVLAAGASMAMAFALPGCGMANDRLPDYRYRLTVEVDTPEGLRTGSSVIEVRTALTGKNSIPDPGKLERQARGEAVAVDLGQRGVLFALLRSEDSVDWASFVVYALTPSPPSVAQQPFDWRQYVQDRFDAMLKQRGVIALPRQFQGSRYIAGGPARPMLVRFGDITDPATVAKVDPDDLAASYGPAVKLRRITVQLTDDPVTTGIEKRLRWLATYRNRHFDESGTSSEDMTTKKFAAHMSSGNFSTEFAK